MVTELLPYLAQRALEGFINTNFKGILRGLCYYHVHFTEDGNEITTHRSVVRSHQALGHTVLMMLQSRTHAQLFGSGTDWHDTFLKIK